MISNDSIYYEEAERISDYLIGILPGEREKKIYADACKQLDIQFTAEEDALWKSMNKSKWRMACIDAGLALKQPSSNARRKLFTMLAILEASPTYTDYFLSKNFSPFYIIKIGLVGIRSVCRALLGLVLVKMNK